MRKDRGRNIRYFHVPILIDERPSVNQRARSSFDQLLRLSDVSILVGRCAQYEVKECEYAWFLKRRVADQMCGLLQAERWRSA